MTTSEQNEAAARACIDAFNKGTAEWVDMFYSEDVEWVELPRQVSPAGRRGNRAILHQAAEQMNALFSDRKMTIINLIAQGDQVVMELDWRGTSSLAIGGTPAGTPARARIANFLKYDLQGKIIKHVDYVISMPATSA